MEAVVPLAVISVVVLAAENVRESASEVCGVGVNCKAKAPTIEIGAVSCVLADRGR